MGQSFIGRFFACLIGTLLVSICTAQWGDYYTLTFEDTLNGHVVIDTADGHSGLWQIGSPQKALFTSAHSTSNVMVTDTMDPYPPNAASSFIVIHGARDGWIDGHTVNLSGYYYTDTDSLSDFGTIELQYHPDSAWIDILNDPLYSTLVFPGPAPALTGSSNGWTYFYLFGHYLVDHIQSLGYQFTLADTIRWRFGFTSDSLDTGRDGLMFDDLLFEDWTEGIPEHSSSDFHSSIAPIPASSQVTLTMETAGIGGVDITIRNSTGLVMRKERTSAQHKMTLDVSDLPAGLYVYELRSTTNDRRSMGRFEKL